MEGILKTDNERTLKKIKIGKSFYKVVKCDKLIFRNKNYIGFIDYDIKTIYLKNHKNIKETFRHELTHAFIYEIYKKKRKKIYLKLRSDEFFINALSELIEQNFYFKN